MRYCQEYDEYFDDDDQYAWSHYTDEELEAASFDADRLEAIQEQIQCGLHHI